MRKIGLLLVILVLCTFLIAGYAKPFRLHIIANSNSFEDQQVKLLVRDAVLAATKEEIVQCASKEEAEEYIEGQIDKIVDIAEDTLRENGFGYGAEAVVGVYDFPDKTYGDATYPAGKYDALRIILGRGEGENWWCVMFPPLCIINMEAETEEDEEVEYASFIVEWFQKLLNWGERL